MYTSRIPEEAWRVPLGMSPENPGRQQPKSCDIGVDDGYWQGAPVGGFGAGTFSRTYRGLFERWHIKAGVHKYQCVPGNQFAFFAQEEGLPPMALVLSVGSPGGNALSSWNWGYPAGAGEYAALFPKSWYSYDLPGAPVVLKLEQFSPILPHNYRETSYPVAVYKWAIENTSTRIVTASILFSWTNMIGWFRDMTPAFSGVLSHGNFNTPFVGDSEDGTIRGILFDRIRDRQVTEEWDGQFAIATLLENNAEFYYLASFNPRSSGAEIWSAFSADGTLPNHNTGIVSAGEEIAAAIAVRVVVKPGEIACIPMTLAWDLPIVQFGAGRKWLRRYTRFFSSTGTNACEIARTALRSYDTWSDAIDRWHNSFVEERSTPQWYRAELFNELYHLPDVGMLWGYELLPDVDASFNGDEGFTHLECYDYPYLGTLDVRFYGSWPLLMFWPELEKKELLQYARAAAREDRHYSTCAWMVRVGKTPDPIPRKVRGSLPHDLGNPREDPLFQINQYNWLDTSTWRDLAAKYVMLVWRDYWYTGKSDLTFLREHYPTVLATMEHLSRYDVDRDGLIEHGDFPDQTFDTWPARGSSAYTGGLYLAALKAVSEIAAALDDPNTCSRYAERFLLAQRSYIQKLWNGHYFNYDTGSDYKTASMAAQLTGQWYALLTGLGDIVPKTMRISALEHIFKNNVLKFNGGLMGAVNGVSADGHLLCEEQAAEVWAGITFALASHMILEGMPEAGFKTANGVHNVVWDYSGRGYWFRTPEAYDTYGEFRASMYMRPMAIWAIAAALRLAAGGNPDVCENAKSGILPPWRGTSS